MCLIMRNLYNDDQPCGLFSNAVSFPEVIIIDMPATNGPENVFLLLSKKHEDSNVQNYQISCCLTLMRYMARYKLDIFHFHAIYMKYI